MSRLEVDLAAYYDREAAERHERSLDPQRVTRREEFTALLAAEGRGHLLEVGTGPGRDAVAFQQAGLTVRGVDLSARSAALCRAAGVDCQVASVLGLPFTDASFDSAWTMSTLLHVPDADVDAALRELRRVLVPGSPLAVGVWAGDDVEGPADEAGGRFFSFRSDARLQELLGAHGEVERFDTWPSAGSSYQWCVVRLG